MNKVESDLNSTSVTTGWRLEAYL